MRRRGAVALLLVLTAATTAAGCGRAHPPPAISSTVPSPSTVGSSPGLAGGGEQTTTARSTIISTPRPSLSAPAGVRELPGPCPYIADQVWADQEGNRVGRSVRLASDPVGCRFYFAYDAAQITGEIRLQRFATATEAFNAVATAATGHPEFVDDRSIGDGSISIRTPLQGTPTWECVFARGRLVVTVHTSQSDTSNNARTLARLIVPTVP